MISKKYLLIIFGILWIAPSVLGEDIRYDSGSKRDPFIPLVTAEGGVITAKKFDPSDINIEGIIYDPHGDSMVLINGEFYKQGDNINGANLISIFRDRVILSKSDEKKTLWIREETLKNGEIKNVPKKNAPAAAEPKK